MEEFTKIIKNLFREKINIVILLLIAIIGLNAYQIIDNKINYTKIRKRIDFRYFNLTKSMEDIHFIEIDTKTGEKKTSRN